MGGQVNLTLADLEAYRGQGSGVRSGKYLRYYCPVHGSDKQRSLSLNPETGYFKCFACGAWGYLKEYRQKSPWRLFLDTEPRERPELRKVLQELQRALPGSLGEKYLLRRGIPLELATVCGVGYAAWGKWPHLANGRLVRQWKWGRLVFPHTNPDGEVINLYGRAVGDDTNVPKEERHDHLPGPKGIFNAKALLSDTVFVCEGVFDALSLMAAGYNAVAIFGVTGLRWEWVKAKRVVFCLDRDAAGERWRELAWEGILRGKEVYFLPHAVYRGYKDLNEVWVATKRLDIGAWEKTSWDMGVVVDQNGESNHEQKNTIEEDRLEDDLLQSGWAKYARWYWGEQAGDWLGERCGVCEHPEKEIIEYLYGSGISAKYLAEKYKLKKEDIYSHHLQGHQGKTIPKSVGEQGEQGEQGEHTFIINSPSSIYQFENPVHLVHLVREGEYDDSGEGPSSPDWPFGLFAEDENKEESMEEPIEKDDVEKKTLETSSTCFVCEHSKKEDSSTCPVCKHPERENIEYLYEKGMRLIDLHKRFNISPAELAEHLYQHVQNPFWRR